MSLAKHYIQTATELISDYNGNIPFAIFLKEFFAGHKKYGSRDRRSISALCYSYFRLGKASSEMPVDEKILLAFFLCSNAPGNLLEQLNKEWNSKSGLPLPDKLQITGNPSLLKEIAPLAHLLSEEMNSLNYATHFLTQPNLFTRIRPGHKDAVVKQLQNLQWDFKEEGPSAIRLPAGLPVDKHFKINSELVIQDLNSQHVGEIIRKVFEQNNFFPKNMWDCCAASGGKSMMMYDLDPGMGLTVSDIRTSILHNLKQRFAEAGIKKFKSFVTDLSQPNNRSTNQQASLPIAIGTSDQPIDLLLADVPCTGSGTWSRTPEQLYFFDERTLSQFSERQVAIVSNAVASLQRGGWLVYITCSVFKAENETVIERLLLKYALVLVHSQIIDGTMQRADSMFVAIMKLAE